MKSWLLVALLGVGLRVGAEPLVELAFARDRVVVQGPFECFPSSIYNVLQIAGRSVPRYAEFLREIGGKPARRRPDCPRFQSARTEVCTFEGTRNDEERAMIQDAALAYGLPSVEAGFFARRPDEAGEAFVFRVHAEILAALREGLPLISRLLLLQDDGTYINHANMVFGVSEQPFYDPERGWVFRLKVFEQEWGGGVVLELLVSERVTRAPRPFIERTIGLGVRREFKPEARGADWADAFPELQMRTADGGWEPLYGHYDSAGRPLSVFLELAYGRLREANLIPAYPAPGPVTAAVSAE